MLVATNPYRQLPIYGQSVLREILAERRSSAQNSAAREADGQEALGPASGQIWKQCAAASEPHIYSVALNALERAQRRQQVVVTAGEAGAGKTETAKHLLEVFRADSPGQLDAALQASTALPHG